jgi:hypothetical protein
MPRVDNEQVAAMHDRDLGFEEFQRIFGPARPLTLEQARDLFAGSPFEWWVCGGWSTEMEPEPHREHEDLEIGVARVNLPAVREWLREFHLCDVHGGALRFLWPETTVDGDHEQLWVRRDARSPWLFDLMLTPVEDGLWFYKRDRRVARPLSEAIVSGPDGIPRQRPEIALLFKARRREARDEQDFDFVVPRLRESDRRWLRDAIALTEPPDNPWLARLAD